MTQKEIQRQIAAIKDELKRNKKMSELDRIALHDELHYLKVLVLDRAKYDQLEEVLGECFDIELLPKIEEDWNAFYNDPEAYAGTVVVDMVNQYIDEQPVRGGRVVW